MSLVDEKAIIGKSVDREIGKSPMKKSVAIVLGGVVGTAVGLAVNYLFGAASTTTFDERYQSRWDLALQEGRQAAAEHELELRRQLAAAKASGSSIS